MEDGQHGLLHLPAVRLVVDELNHNRELVLILRQLMEERLVHEFLYKYSVVIHRPVQQMEDGQHGLHVMQDGHVLLLVLNRELVLILRQLMEERLVHEFLYKVVHTLDLLHVHGKYFISRYLQS